METDDAHATRKSSSLVQNILFNDYCDVPPAHIKKIGLKSYRKLLVHSCTILLCCLDGKDDPYTNPNMSNMDLRVG